MNSSDTQKPLCLKDNIGCSCTRLKGHEGECTPSGANLDTQKPEAKAKKQFRRRISDIEAGAYYTAAEVLLIGLRHIKEHKVSYPIGTTPEEWEKIVDELIWYMEFLISDEFAIDADVRKRYDEAEKLLGKHFRSIWC